MKLPAFRLPKPRPFKPLTRWPKPEVVPVRQAESSRERLRRFRETWAGAGPAALRTGEPAEKLEGRHEGRV
jgi:hypothetical protein